MANVVNFKINGLTAALINQYVRVTDTARNELYSGNTLTTDVDGNATIDLLGAGTVGQDTLITGDDFLNAGLLGYKGFRGTGVIEGNGSILIDGRINIVTIGASIMQRSFDRTNDAARIFYESTGLVVNVFNRATSGDTSTLARQKLPVTLTEFAGQEAYTIMPVHIGGNDVSANAYPNANPVLDNEHKAILQSIVDDGFYCVPSSISYRIPPASNPTEPYNTNTIIPNIEAIVPSWVSGSIPIVDMHKFYFDNQSLIHPDGIHPLDVAAEDATAEYWAERIATKFTQVNPPNVGVTDWVIQLGESVTTTLPNWIETVGSLDNLSNVDGFTSIYGGISSSTALSDSQGRGNAGDTSESLTNNGLLSGYLYVDDDAVQVIPVNVGNANMSATYTVSITASRDTTSLDRLTDYHVGGVTKRIDAKSNPPEIVTFTGVTGQQLLDNDIRWNKVSSSSFGYISGIRITKE